MTRATVLRSGAVLVSAALLASLALVTVAAPTAAKLGCGGYPATIVGTNKGEVIRGTNKRDVIVARGGDDRVFGRAGNDVICGGLGNDRLYGGPGDDRLYGQAGRDILLGARGSDLLRGGMGPDRLFAGAGRDHLDGGGARDRCVQGPGAGPHYRCEVVPRVKPRNLAIAFSDLDGDHRYGPGDVLISRLFDTNGDGVPSKGDTVYMGRFPLDFEMTAFADWGVNRHRVAGWNEAQLRQNPRPHSLESIYVTYAYGGWAGGGLWQAGRANESFSDWQIISHVDGRWDSRIQDAFERPAKDSSPNTHDFIWADERTPSRPTVEVSTERAGAADDRFIDIVVYP